MADFEIPDVPMADFVVTCVTDGCENAGIPITVSCDAANPTVICGPCCNPITDVVRGE